ncbi:MAG: tetratricopeptide repeat protein, partial [Candidatus Aminicenantes bacterium]
ARSIKGKGITGAGVMVGTPDYMSPEQAEVKEVDQRSDIYSLGVILYEMVTGRVPFEGETPLSIAMKHKSETPKDPKELNSQIPEDLSNVILRCMEKDKEKRYQSAGEVRSELSKIEEDIPTTERVVPKRKSTTSKEITVSFRPKKLLIPALVVIALVIAVVIILQLLPQKEAVRSSIAVISFENQTGDKAYDYLQKAIPNLLITSLEQSRYLQVATWERLHDLLKQRGKEDVEIIDRDLAFELCRLEGIDAIVLGSFIKAGDVFATDVKVLDVESKNLLKSASSRGKGVQSILEKQIDELSKEISRGIGLSERKIESTQTKIASVTTTSMEAYNYYLKGREASSKVYHDDARKFYEKAVELDPTFAMAYLQLGYSYGVLQDTKASNDAYEKAKRFSDRATRKEKLYIEASYALSVEGDPEKQIRILKQILKEYPEEARIHFMLGYRLYRMDFVEEAIEEFNQYLEVHPNPTPSVYNQLGYIYKDKWELEKSLEYITKYVELSPNNANAVDSLAELYFTMGRLDDSIAKYKDAIDIKQDFFEAYFRIGYIYALKEDYSEAMKWIDKFTAIAPSSGIKAESYLWKGFFHYWLGSIDQSLDDLRRIPDLVEATENEWLKGFSFWLTGCVYCDKGEYDQSREFHKKWFDVWNKIYPKNIKWNTALNHIYLGYIDLKERRIDAAESHLAEMKSLLSEITENVQWLEFFHDSLYAEILLAKNRIDDVISLCGKIFPLELPWMYTNQLLFYNTLFLRDVLARAYREKGELDKAIAEYERLFSFDPESKERHLIHPKYHYRLAKLYEEKGWEGKAIEFYEKFLLFWKDADPGIAEVEDAKKRLTGLKE